MNRSVAPLEKWNPYSTLGRDNADMHRTTEELIAQLDRILQSPTDNGVIEMIVRRPSHDEREVVDAAVLEVDQ